MGALHAGHRSLIDRAVAENDRVVVTIFVNPAQFGPNEDFARYPRTLEADLAMLAEAGVHAAFVPSVETMYPPGLVTRIDITGSLGERLEGASRPGPFQRGGAGRHQAPRRRTAPARVLRTEGRPAVCSSFAPRPRPRRRRRYRCVPNGSRSRRARDLEPQPLSQPRRSSARNGHSIEPGLCASADSRPANVMRQRWQQLFGPALENAGLDVDYVAVVKADDFTEVEKAAPTDQIVLAARIGSTRLIDVVRLGVDTAPVGRGV